MHKLFTTLVLALATLTGLAAVNPADYLDMKLGKEYELKFMDTFKGKFTPTEDGMLVEYGAMPVFTLSANGELELLETNYAGYIFGKQAWQFRAVKGTTYFFADDFVMYDCKFSIDLSPAMKLVKAYPAAGRVYDLAAYGGIELTLNQLATVDAAIVKCGEHEGKVSVSVIGSNVGVACNELLEKWYAEGKINGGEELSVTLTGISDMMGNPAENITVSYIAGHAPVRMLESQLPDKVLSWYASPELNSKATFTFSGPIQAKPLVRLCYAPIELGYEYIDTITPQVNGNTLTIDLAGKRRTSADMSTSGRTDPMIYLQLLNLKDSTGQVVSSPGQGTIGTFLYELPFQNIERLNITSEFTPAAGAKLLNTNEIKIYFNSADHLTYSGVRFAAGDMETIIGMDQIGLEQISATEVELTVAVPNQFKGLKNVVVTLANLIADEGFDHTADISALYNGFVVNFCNVVAHSKVAQMAPGFAIKAETNLAAGEALSMAIIGPDGKSIFGPAEMNCTSTGTYIGVVTQQLAFTMGLTYTLQFTCTEGTVSIPFMGATAPVEYSPTSLVSISPDSGSDIASDQAVTVTFDGMVELQLLNDSATLFSATPVDPESGFANVWTLTPTAGANGTITLAFKAFDMDGLQIHNANSIDSSFAFTYKVTTSGINTLSLPAAARIYDLQGRPVANPSHGLYIVNGRTLRL